MDDLISRQAAIILLKAKLAEIFFKETAEKNIEKWLNELPAVQPEQKTGRWIICSDGYYPYCSQCLNEPKNRIMTKYCGECGAKMKSEVTE